MRNFKKVVAGLLAVLMLALSVNVSFAAENYTEDEAVVVAKVNGAGIMTGTDKGFEPSKSLTRAEAAAIIVRMKGISESAVKATAGATLFTDVAASHWASGYVNQASNLGIIKGVSATQFAPDREVTIAEFTTMAVRALGAGQLVDSEGTWPTNYVNFANENKILDDVNAIYTAVSTRMQAATIVANTLEADMWAKTGVKSNGEIEWSKRENVKMYKEILKLDNMEAAPCTKVSIKDNKFNTSKTVKTLDLSNIKVGLTYEGWVNEDDEVVALWPAKDYKSVEFTEIKKINTSKKEITLVVDEKETKYDYDSYDYYYNQVKNGEAIKESKNLFGQAYIVNDKIVRIFAEEYTSFGVVDEITSNKIKFLSTADAKGATKTGSLVINDEDVDYVVLKDGVSVGLDGIKEDDALFFYHITDSSLDEKYVIEICTDVVKGEVTAKKSGKIYIDGTKYSTDLNLNLEDEVTAYLNKAGDIVMFVLDEEAKADTALVSYIRKTNGSNAGSYGYNVELTYMDGTKSDRLSLDLVDTYDEFNKADATTAQKETYVINMIDEAISNNTVTSKFQGFTVNYEISGDKVTFKPVDDEVNAVAANATLTVGNKNVTIEKDKVQGVTGAVYVTSSTSLLKVKADDEYGIKVEAIEFEDLDNSVFKGKSYVIGYDKDSKTVDAVIFGIESTVKRSAELSLGYVVDSVDTKYNKDNAKKLTIYWQDGHKDSYYTNSDLTNGTVAIGDVKDITVKDDVITDVNNISSPEALNESATGLITEFVEDKGEITIGGQTKYLADDVVILAIDKDSDDTFTFDATKAYSYKVLNASDLEAVDFAEETTYVVLRSLEFTDSDSNKEIKFMVVFNKDLDKIAAATRATAFVELAKLAGFDAAASDETVTITIDITEDVAANAKLTVEGVELTCAAGVTYNAQTANTADFTVTFE